jgi:hypothetical protein
MPNFDVVTHAGEQPYEPNLALVYCNLIGDRVAERVCHLLKEELKTWWRGASSCRGCCGHWLR